MNDNSGIGNDDLGDVKDLEKPEDLEPKGKKKQIWDLLLDGISEEDLSKEPYNFNKKTIGIVAWELNKAGLRQRPSKKHKDKPTGMVKGTEGGLPVTTPPTAIKASSPEALIDTLVVPTDGQKVDLADGIKVGLSLAVLGVRMAQELSAIGVQQARPLVAMAREMRAGEEAAARMASKETAYEMSGRIQDYITPALNELGEMIAQQSAPARPAGPNPIQEMMARVVEPVFQNLISSLIPGAAPTQNAPTGWKRVTRAPIKEEKGDDARSTKNGPGSASHK